MWIEGVRRKTIRRVINVLWMSWDEIREHVEDYVIEIECYNKYDQAFIFDNKEEFTKLLHKTLDKAIQKSDIEDI